MPMFGKTEPKKAAGRVPAFGDGRYIVNAHCFLQELLGDQICFKIGYTCLADASTAPQIEPGVKGESALFKSKKAPTDPWTYVAKDLANYFGAALAAELGRKEPFDPDTFVMNQSSKNGGTPIGSKDFYPAGESIEDRLAWLEKAKDADGKWSIEELITAKFRSARPLVLTVAVREGVDGEGKPTALPVHTFDLLTPKLQALLSNAGSEAKF